MRLLAWRLLIAALACCSLLLITALDSADASSAQIRQGPHFSLRTPAFQRLRDDARIGGGAAEDSLPWAERIVHSFARGVLHGRAAAENGQFHSHHGPVHGRHLAGGDFDSLNALLAGVTISIPEDIVISEKFPVDTGFPFYTLDLNIDATLVELKCRSVSIVDLGVTSAPPKKAASGDDSVVAVTAIAKGVTLSCETDWIFSGSATKEVFGWKGLTISASGEGEVSLKATVDSFRITVDFHSKDFSRLPPSKSVASGCSSEVTVHDLVPDFRQVKVWTLDATWLSGALWDAFGADIQKTLKDELQPLACKELKDLGTSMLTDLLANASAAIAPYAGDPVAQDPLAGERNLPACLASANRTAREEKEEKEGMVNFTDNALLALYTNYADAYLNGDQNGTLGVNVLMRRLLNSSGGMDLPLDDFGSADEDECGENNEAKEWALSGAKAPLCLGGVTGHQCPAGYSLDPSRAASKIDGNGNSCLSGEVKWCSRCPVDISGVVLLDTNDMLTRTTMTLTGVAVDGLASFTAFRPFQPVAAHTLSHELAMDYLNVAANLTLVMRPSTTGEVVVHESGKSVTEHITVSAGIRGLLMRASTLLALDLDDILSLRLGSVVAAPMPCALSTLACTNLTALFLKVQQIPSPTLSGFISKGLDRFFSDTVGVAFQLYHGALKAALPNFFATDLRRSLDDALRSYLAEPNSTACALPPPAPTDPRDLLDFRTDETFALLKEGVDQLMGQLGTVLPASLVLPDALLEQRGEIEALGRFNVTVGAVSVEGMDTLRNMTLLEPVKASRHELQNSFELGNLSAKTSVHVSLLGERHDIVWDFDLKFSLEQLRVLLRLLVQVDLGLLRHMRLGDMLDMDCWLALIPPGGAAVRDFITSIGAMRAGMHCRNCSSPGIAALAEKLRTPGAQEEMRLGVQRILTELGETASAESFLRDTDEYLTGARGRCAAKNGVSPDASGGSGSGRADAGAGDADGEVQGFGAGFYVAVVGCALFGVLLPLALFARWLRRRGDPRVVRVCEWLDGAASRLKRAVMCRFKEGRAYEKQGSGMDMDMDMGMGMGMDLDGRIDMEKARAAGEQGPAVGGGRLSFRTGQGQGPEEEEEEDALVLHSKALVSSAATVPLAVRVGIPVIILANAALFLSGHIQLGATVDVLVRVAGETIRIDEFFVFSIAKSTIQMYQAGAVALAVVIVVFSGIWPYTKLGITMALWCAPPRRVHPDTRGSTLIWLDVLGKWSMIDIFVLVVSMVAFRVSFFSPAGSRILPDDFYNIDLFVTPVWGLFANMIAQIVSQLLSHVIIYYHRNTVSAALRCARIGTGGRAGAVEAGEATAVDAPLRRTARAPSWVDAGTRGVDGAGRPFTGAKEALRSHVFRVGGEGEGESGGAGTGTGTAARAFRVRWYAQVLVVACTGLVVLLLFAGCSMPSFRMHMKGLANVAAEFGEEGSSTRDFSVFGVASLLSKQAHTYEDTATILGINFLTVLFVTCALVVPVLQMVMLLVLWVLPLNLRRQKSMVVVNEILSAWQYLEVYLIAVLVATLQVGQVSGFMVGNYCDSLGPVIDTFASFGLLVGDTMQTCFYIEASVRPGAYFLLAGSILLNLVCQFIIRAAHSAIEDRESRIHAPSYRKAKKKKKKAKEKARRRLLRHNNWFRYLLEAAGRCCIGEISLPQSNQPQVHHQLSSNLGFSHQLPDASSFRSRAPNPQIPDELRTPGTGTGTGRRSPSRAAGEPVNGSGLAPRGLPGGWEEWRDENTGDPFFFHPRTGRTSWSRPSPAPARSMVELTGVRSSDGGRIVTNPMLDVNAEPRPLSQCSQLSPS